ncbi:MAG TPA: pyridoxamine 5'-phosphate oxidase family protein [Candidatus Borkfalkia avistercoris]|uniref:Pyridoxamine 5'-phosphate oxidase family protein n=1 Tax=Candidatus Borkfalkia avistercoris TaxID=2838504 RepID=A0A9D2IE64_9FIRM|nr:pyridoxamine 5'-phosphate oxidase family protein [Candidatus Borkfalkia avistercoris]
MRRKRQALSVKECEEILQNGTSGVLAVSGDEGYPYAVPLSYVYAGGKIYFHGARNGHKTDALRRSDKASFCVIAEDRVVPEEFTTYFKSVIAFGRVRELPEGEARAAAVLLAGKYCPRQGKEAAEREISGEFSALCMLEMTVEHLTGKQAIELARAKKE